MTGNNKCHNKNYCLINNFFGGVESEKSETAARQIIFLIYPHTSADRNSWHFCVHLNVTQKKKKNQFDYVSDFCRNRQTFLSLQIRWLTAKFPLRSANARLHPASTQACDEKHFQQQAVLYLCLCLSRARRLYKRAPGAVTVCVYINVRLCLEKFLFVLKSFSHLHSRSSFFWRVLLKSVLKSQTPEKFCEKVIPTQSWNSQRWVERWQGKIFFNLLFFFFCPSDRYQVLYLGFSPHFIPALRLSVHHIFTSHRPPAHFSPSVFRCWVHGWAGREKATVQWQQEPVRC